MPESEKDAPQTQTAAVVALCLAFLSVWAYLQQQIYMNTDLGWLFLCLERFLDGGTYTQDFYETNPPLSFLIYLPAMLFHKAAGWSAQFSIFFEVLLLIALSGFLFLCLLNRMDTDRRLIYGVMSAFLFTQTWLMGASFGLKDHLVFLWLLPLALLQYMLTFQQKIPRSLATAIAFFGALAICLKPHYAVIPALFFLHRAFVRRGILSILTSPDFLTLLAAGLAYIVLVALVFPDYLPVILPETQALYSAETPFIVMSRLNYLVFPAVAVSLATLFILRTDDDTMRASKKAVYGLAAISFLCVLPYLMQNKGFHYQTLPFLGTGVMAFMTACYAVTLKYLKKPVPGIVLALSLITLITYPYMLGSNGRFLTPEEFRDLPFHRKIEEKAWNGIYAIPALKSLNLSLPWYTTLRNGSRFGLLWPLMGLSEKMKIATNEEEKESIRREMNRYIDMIAEDNNRFEPAVIAIPRYLDDATGEYGDHYYRFLMRNENFRNSMAPYQFTESFTFDEHIYDKGGKRLSDKETEITYDLYVRKQNNNPPE